MRVTHNLCSALLIDDGEARIAIDPGQYLWLFKLKSLIPDTDTRWA